MSFLKRASRAKTEQRDLTVGEAAACKPAFAALLGLEPSPLDDSISPAAAMSLSAVRACVELISGTISSLPLRAVQVNADGTTIPVQSWLDDPGGPDGPTPFEYVEGLYCDLLLRGNHFARKVRNSFQEILWVDPLPPGTVNIEDRNVYRVTVDGTSQVLTDYDILHIPYMPLDGIRGVSPIESARRMLRAALAAERVSERLFKSGLLASAIITPTEDLSPEELVQLAETLTAAVGGERKAGAPAVFNKNLNVQKWQINPADAQFLESRQFSVTEIARLFQVPPHLIGDATNSTSWGSGLESQVAGYQKFVLTKHTSRVESRLSRLLPDGLRAQFDYRNLLAADPKTEIDTVIEQLAAGLLTLDEARAMLNRPPIPEQGPTNG